MRVIRVKLSDLENWEKNPRTADPADLKRLVRQLEKLGQYKPLVAFKRGTKYVVLGGNMRLRAYREMGLEAADVSVVEAKTEGRRIAISLSDNDRAGHYDELALAELLWEHKDAIEQGLFKIDLGAGEGLDRVLESLGEDVAPTLAYPMRQQPGGPVICPNCGAVVEEGKDGPEEG